MKILIVEDDPLYRNITAKTVGKAGHHVILAADGVEAVTKSQHEKFDIVITDLFMPNKEGIEVISDIRQGHPDVKIIAMSSDGVAGHTSFLKIAEACGANASLQKPFTAAQLLEKIDEVSRK